MTSESKARQAPTKKRLPIDGIGTLSELLAHIGVTEWDALIVGDGSGVGWKMGAGWAAVLVDRYSNARKLFYGAMNTGTITLGELMPYLHALSWYASKDGPGHQRKNEVLQLNRALKIHIVTDSQIIATCGNNPTSRRAHQELWKPFDEYKRRGFDLTFHFVERARVDLNVLVDEVSRQARADIEETFARAVALLAKTIPELPPDVSIYDFSS